MAAGKTSPASKAGEVASEAVQIEFLGQSFDGPPVLPATFALDVAMVGDDLSAIGRLLHSIFTDEQIGDVREAIAAQDVSDGGSELLGELLKSIPESYEVGEGE